MSKLFIDDIRQPHDVKVAWHDGYMREFPSIFAWEVVRTYDEFTEFILKNGLPTEISFDHDLGIEHYPTSVEEMTKPIDYSKYKERTGYHAAQWLVDYCYTNDLDIPEFYVHSFNPVGRMNIVNYLVRSKEILAALRNPKRED